MTEGYTTQSSFNLGESVEFCVSSSVPYRIEIFRLGTDASPAASLEGGPSLQDPHVLRDLNTGLAECKWSTSVTWDTGNVSYKSGIYEAKLYELDSNTLKNCIYFVLRNDNADADILVCASDSTWQAYNTWGGANLYQSDETIFPKQDLAGLKNPDYRGVEVSFDRPYIGEPPCLTAERQLARWFDLNGYNVKYCSTVDVDKGHVFKKGPKVRVFVSAGHDEYWSYSQRKNVEAARDSGMHLAFLSGDVCFWKTYFTENHRRLVCTKETYDKTRNIWPQPGRLATLISECWTGYWGEPNDDTAAEKLRPETDLTGSGWRLRVTVREKVDTTRINVPPSCASHFLWQGTTFFKVGGELPTDTLWWEWDGILDDCFGNPRRPAGPLSNYAKLSETKVGWQYTPLNGDNDFVPDSLCHRSRGPDLPISPATHNLLYFVVGESKVFSAGAINWSLGLFPVNPVVGEEGSIEAQNIFMRNVFNDMGVTGEPPGGPYAD